MHLAFTVAKLALREYAAYRLNFLLEVAGMFVFLAVSLLIWLFLFNQQGGVIAGYTRNEMITYLLGAALLASFLLFAAQGNEIDQDIKDGHLSVRLSQPFSVVAYWLTRDFVRKLTLLAMGLVSFAVIAALAFPFLFTPSIPNILIGLAAVLIALMLHAAIFLIFALFSFWFEYAWGFLFFGRILIELTAGLLVPLTLFPQPISGIFQALPFQYLAYFPLEIMLGRIQGPALVSQFAAALAWLGVCAVLAAFVWRQGVKSYTAVGN